MRVSILRQVLEEVNVKELYIGEYIVTKDKVIKIMNTIKENKEISKYEARFIQYSKILMMFIFLSLLLYKFVDKSILIQCF